MNQEQRQSIIVSQRDAFKRHGYHPNALFWSNKEVQELRFKMLTEVGIQSGDSVLDIGCGFGDYYAYLSKNNLDVDFTGIDLSEELVTEGLKQYQDIRLFIGDLFDYGPKPESVDYLTLSGTLNRKLGDNGEYALNVIERMIQTCKKGVAFNVLDARHDWTAGRWDLQSFQPDEILKFVSQYSKKAEIVDGYLENDFTVYLWKT